MTGQVRDALLDIEDYLAGERSSPVKHEYAAGHVYAMAGASERHNRIALNCAVHLHRATAGSACRTFISDMRLRIDQVVYYPDLMVCCDPSDDDPWLKRSPCLVIEVLSESTERIDRGEKLHNYRRLDSLRAYVLVAQEPCRVEVYRRADDGSWRYECLEGADAELALDCPPTRIALSEVYARLEMGQ